MTSNLQNWFTSLEAQKRALLDRVDAMSENARQAAPPNQWSPLQVIEHLVGFEENMNRWTRSVAPGTVPGLKGRVFSAVVSGTMRSGLPIPAPPGVEVGVPDTLPNLCARWEKARGEMRIHLDAVSEGTRAAYLVHPLAGPLTAEQMLRLNDAHLFYHLHHRPFRGVKP